jgi:4'-phosphopantetheinyl transferase
MSTALWTVRLHRPLTDRETRALLALAPPERQTRVLRLRDADKRREPLCAYLLLRQALWERYRWRTLPKVETAPAGKPAFPAYPTVHFNLSHTDGAVLVGLSDRPVGVDIERLRPLPRRQMAAAVLETYFQSWVRREARTKRTGAGITAMLRTETPMEPEEAYLPLSLFPGYAAGVAFTQGEIVEPVRRCSLDALTEAWL